MNTQYKHFKNNCIPIALLLLLSQQSYASPSNEDTSAGASSDENTASIERIIVTADLSKRNLSELPATALVLNQSTIEAREARHLQDLINVVPNLNFSSGASRGKFVQIRGIGERSQFAEPINPSIGLLLDDVDISGIGGLTSVYDIAQLEVLSGPQSVASGVNSVGGIVKLVSNKATSSQYANVTLSYAQYNESRLAGTYSGALSDSANARFSFQQTKSDGFIENAFLERNNTNNIDETTATALFNVELSQSSDLDVNVYYFDINNGYDAFSLDNDKTLSDEPGYDTLEATAASVKYTHRFTQHELQISGYVLDATTEYAYDEDWTFVGIHPDGYSSFDFYQREIFRNGIDAKLASVGKAKHSYLVGLNLTQNEEDLLRQNTFLEADYITSYKPVSASLYGQHIFKVSEKATLTSAARVEKFDADFNDNLGFTGVNDTLLAASVAFDYKLANNLVFANVSRGYKAGGFNIDPRLDVNNRTFDPEYNLNYELGIKGSAYDGIANLNLTFFYMARNDAQISDSVLFAIDDTGASSFADAIGNADTGINKGIELTSTWDLFDNFYVQANIAYLDATFGNYTKVNGDFVAVQQQAQAPKYTGYLSSTWAISEQLTWFIDMDVKDDFRLGINHDVRSPFTAVINSELSWKSVGKHLYSLKLWVKNIADRDVITRGFGSFPNDPRDGYSSFGPYFQYGQPRQVGVTFKYEWE
jgi:iron complex outermembrane receptor protein